MLERNREPFRSIGFFTEGSNNPLMKQDSLEESDVLSHFSRAQQLLA